MYLLTVKGYALSTVSVRTCPMCQVRCPYERVLDTPPVTGDKKLSRVLGFLPDGLNKSETTIEYFDFDSIF